MIKAKVTIFDDETGEIHEEDKIIDPCRIESVNLDIETSFIAEEYIFKFSLMLMTIKGE